MKASPDRTPTIRLIAEACGYGKSTVSLALRHDPSIPVATRDRIAEVAAKLGYRPNPGVAAVMAHVRRSRKTRMEAAIAIVNVRPSVRELPVNSVLSRYIAGARARADALGYGSELFHLDKAANMSRERLEKILKARSIAGLFVLPLRWSQGHLSFDWASFAAATVGYSLVRPDLPRVCNHNASSMMKALRELRHRGYRRVGLAMPAHHDRRTSHMWRAVYLGFQSLYGSESPIPLHLPEEWDETAFVQWFETHRPDAIVSTEKRVHRWLLNAGFDVPGEVAFATLDRFSDETVIAGVDQNYELVAASAIDLIVGQLHRNDRGIPEIPKTTMIPGTWCDGATVGRRQPPP